jgi:hypothetical protein
MTHHHEPFTHYTPLEQLCQFSPSPDSTFPTPDRSSLSLSLSLSLPHPRPVKPNRSKSPKGEQKRKEKSPHPQQTRRINKRRLRRPAIPPLARRRPGNRRARAVALVDGGVEGFRGVLDGRMGFVVVALC